MLPSWSKWCECLCFTALPATLSVLIHQPPYGAACVTAAASTPFAVGSEYPHVASTRISSLYNTSVTK